MPQTSRARRTSRRPAAPSEGLPVTEFVRIEAEGLTDRELLVVLLESMGRTHDCVHALERKTEERERIAAEKRHALANSVMSIAGSVRQITGLVGDIKTQQDIDGGRITKLAQGLGMGSLDDDHNPKPKGIGWVSTPKAIGIAAFLAVLVVVVSNAATYGFLRNIVVSSDAYLTALALK